MKSTVSFWTVAWAFLVLLQFLVGESWRPGVTVRPKRDRTRLASNNRHDTIGQYSLENKWQKNEVVEQLEYADKILFRKIARSIASTTKLHSIPLIPQPLVRYYAAQILEQIQLQPQTWQRLNDMWAAQSTPTMADDYQRDQVSNLAHQVAIELQIEKCVHLPLLTAKQELSIVKFVLNAIFQQLTTTAQERRRRKRSQQLETAQTLLNHDRREELVQRLCPKVSLPLIKDREKKESIIRGFVDRAAGVLEAVLPRPVVQTLSGESTDEVDRVKQWAIDKIGQVVGVFPGLSAEQTKDIAHWMVEIFLEDDIQIDDTRPVFYLLSQDEQVDLLRKRQRQVAMELELCQARYERERAYWKGKQNRLTFRVRQVEQQRATRPLSHFKRKMKVAESSTSRLFRRRKSLLNNILRG